MRTARSAGNLCNRSGIYRSYLADDCRLVTNACEQRLRSTASRTCIVTRTHSTFGDRAFTAATPDYGTVFHCTWKTLTYHTVNSVAKDISVWTVGPQHSVLTAPSRNICTYLLTFKYTRFHVATRRFCPFSYRKDQYFGPVRCFVTPGSGSNDTWAQSLFRSPLNRWIKNTATHYDWRCNSRGHLLDWNTLYWSKINGIFHYFATPAMNMQYHAEVGVTHALTSFYSFKVIMNILILPSLPARPTN